MKNYEIVIILKENNLLFLKKFFLSLKKVVLSNFGYFLIFEKWGLLKLSYPIKTFKKGYYVYVSLKLNLVTLIKVEFFLKFRNEVIRFFIVRLNKKNFFISYFISKKILLKRFKKKLIFKKKFFSFKKKKFFLKSNIYNK